MTEGLEPVADSKSEILILGTLPGKELLKAGQYYANPRNQFWKIISNIFNDAIPNSYDERLKVLKEHHIALLDVLKSANRKSSDGATQCTRRFRVSTRYFLPPSSFPDCSGNRDQPNRLSVSGFCFALERMPGLYLY